VLGFEDHDQSGAYPTFCSKTRHEVIGKSFDNEHDRFELLDRLTKWVLDPPFRWRIGRGRRASISAGCHPMRMQAIVAKAGYHVSRGERSELPEGS
jgi:hypothetical protein